VARVLGEALRSQPSGPNVVGAASSRCGPLATRSHPGKVSSVDLPETRYAKTADGAHIAYQVLGDGRVDLREALLPLGLEVRAGLHTGECETIDGKIGGIAVHIGAPVAAVAGASELLVSQTVKGLVAGSGLTFENAAQHGLKGVPDRWQLYRVVK
jgi:hypothetical protein